MMEYYPQQISLSAAGQTQWLQFLSTLDLNNYFIFEILFMFPLCQMLWSNDEKGWDFSSWTHVYIFCNEMERVGLTGFLAHDYSCWWHTAGWITFHVPNVKAQQHYNTIGIQQRTLFNEPNDSVH